MADDQNPFRTLGGPPRDAAPAPAALSPRTEEELLRGLEGLPPAESPGSQRNGY